jgi:2-methylcitrate dehydratase PrpD
MLQPCDYSKNALYNDITRKLMTKIEFKHSKDYDALYPRGIPTSIKIENAKGEEFDSGLIEFPGGHCANQTVSLSNIMQHKFVRLGQIALEKDDLVQFVLNLENIGDMTNDQLIDIYDCDIKWASEPID